MLTIQLFISTWGKSYEHKYHSPPYVSLITGDILITIIRFACYHPLLNINSTFLTDSKYLGTIQIWRNLNEHHSFWYIEIKSYLFAKKMQIVLYSSRWIARMLKTHLLQFNNKPFLNINLTLVHLPQLAHFTSHAFTTLECDSNYFVILLWKIIKPYEHNKIKPPIGKLFHKYKPITHYFVMFQK